MNKNNESNTKLYSSYKHLLQRCYNKKDSQYNRYGGRNIIVCEEWRTNFQTFKKWAYENGYNETEKLSIDRIDNNGNYEPKNCRWATCQQQANNRSTNRFITFKDKTMTVAEWAIICGIKAKTLYYRLNSGWTVENALFKPTRAKKIC